MDGWRNIWKASQHLVWRGANSFNFIQFEKRLHKICEVLIDVPLECIINIDESALQHRTTSSRFYCIANSDDRGVKRSKDRITITLGVSTSCETFTIQVSTKSARPRALKALKHIPDISKTFGIIYDHQPKVWQYTSSYMRLLHKYNKIVKNRNVVFYNCKIIAHFMFVRLRFWIHQVH